MCLFKKYWHNLSRLFNRQWGYFVDDTLLRLLFSQNFARFIQRNSKQATEEFIKSSQFQSIICNILKECNTSPFKEIAEQYLGKNVEITVTVGQLAGVIVAVGDDFLTLQEGIGTEILLPFTSIISIKEA